jgi:hypothetical protein
MTTMNTIQGKTALVTGASRGIGRATALALADAGASVLVHYRSAAEEANAVVAHIRNAGGRAHALKADLGAADGPAVLTQNAREFLDGRLDILVLNAAISKAASVENQTMQDFDNLSFAKSSCTTLKGFISPWGGSSVWDCMLIRRSAKLLAENVDCPGRVSKKNLALRKTALKSTLPPHNDGVARRVSERIESCFRAQSEFL